MVRLSNLFTLWFLRAMIALALAVLFFPVTIIVLGVVWTYLKPFFVLIAMVGRLTGLA